jgi:hypothetical protein
MSFDVVIWIAGLVLSFPILVLGIAWERCGRFSESGETQRRQKLFYLMGLVAASVSTLAYLGYWIWRLCGLYHITVAFVLLLILERSIYICRLLSVFALACFLVGRGPLRVLVFLATFWVMIYLWAQGGIIHWA